jgi:hypothetical protein
MNFKKNFDPEWEAREILMQHSEGVMQCGIFEPKGNAELYEFTLQECAYILTTNLIEGKYSAMEFNAIRNELGKLLNKMFYAEVIREEKIKEASANIAEAVKNLKRAEAEYNRCEYEFFCKEQGK